MNQIIDTSERTCSSGFQAAHPLQGDDRTIARLRTHGNKIRRYQRLLQTKLSDIERQFIERRMLEEGEAMECLVEFDPIVLRSAEIDRITWSAPSTQ